MGSLTGFQIAVINGCLLGDGAMRCKRNALLEINYAYSQKDNVDWKHKLLNQIVSTPPKARKGNAGRVAYRFTTKSLPALTGIYRQFYTGGKKEIPKNLVLKPITLAVWFMDDGNKSYRAIYLNTQQFDHKTQIRLIGMFRRQHGITVRLNRDKRYYCLRIAVASIPAFKRIVGKYILQSFRYKCPL